MHTARVRDYYDANSEAFEKFGDGGSDGAIHRAVWGPGADSRSQAFHYVDQLILEDLQNCPNGPDGKRRVLDLGCGLGSTLIYLATRCEIEGVGVTISTVQAERTRARFAACGLQQRLRCVHGDLFALPETIAPGQLALSIEAFLHSPSPSAYFELAARQVSPGGTLAICDDFLTDRARAQLAPRAARVLEEFRDGWLAASLVTASEANAAAERAGFQLLRTLALTPYLELRRPRDRAISALVALGRHLPIPGYRWRSLVGGNALQLALISGLIEYRYTAWRRHG